ncbi:MAG: hydantoinase/oxoprolinase family protein, partial [Acidimicrobiia bacterium]
AAEAALGALSLGSAADAAAGVTAVIDAAMEGAVRAVTVARGVDPRDLALVAFGGAGPLHACALAGALGMAAVIIPPRAGVLSAMGLLCSPRQRELVRSWPHPEDIAGIDDALASLGQEAEAAVGGDAEVEYAVDCRYRGQSHELIVPEVGAFAGEHQRRNGYVRTGAPVEVVALRARARRPASFDAGDFPPPERKRVEGPAVAVEADCTVWVPEGWVAEPGPIGAWLLTREGT